MKKAEKNLPPKWLRILIPSILIAVWFALAGLGGPYFGRIDQVSDIDLVAFLPESAESTQVNEEAEKFRDENLLPGILVFEASDESIDAADEQALNDLGSRLAALDAIEGDVSPVQVSDDKKAAFVVLPIRSDSDTEEVLAAIDVKVESTGLSGMNHYVTGAAGFSSDLNKAFSGIDGLLLGVALAVVFVILLLVYRSPLLPILVLMTSVFALAVGILIVWQLAFRDIIQLNGQVQGILFILVIGAATDYSLLYVSRFREELHRYTSPWRATVTAVRSAFEPILASGGTVIVGLLCLLFSDLGSNQALGPVGSIGILAAILSALTLLPALLLVFGRAAFWPFRPTVDQQKAEALARRGLWGRVGAAVAAHPRRIWIGTAIVLLAMAAGVSQLRADGIAQSDLILGYSEARAGQEVLTRHFPDGAGSPALVAADAERQQAVVSVLQADEGVDTVSVIATNSPSGFKPLGRAEDEVRQAIREEIQKEIDAKKADLQRQFDEYAAMYGPEAAQQFAEQAQARIPDVEQLVDEAYPFKDAAAKVIDGRILLQVTLKDAPDSDAAQETVSRLRPAIESVDAAARVGGSTAIQLDTNQASLRDRMVIIPLVLGAITVILMVLLRAIIAPILLLLTTVISFGSALGVSALLFNNLWNFPGAEPSVVLYAFVFLVALGIDYNIFLMTRVREEALKAGTKAGVIKGLVVTGGVITSAGIVLAATFAALAVIPILFLVQLAFIVAFGVLLDTFIVRSLLAPALIRDIGSAVWWPSKLKNKQ